MKLRKIFKITVLLIVCVPVLIYSCRKDEIGFSPFKNLFSNAYATASLADSNEVIEQIKWIAKGIPKIAENHIGFISEVHSLCLSNSFYTSSNEEIQDAFQLSHGQSYLGNVESNVDTDFPNNNFDTSYFFEIEIDGCLHAISISIPDCDIADSTDTHVVTYEDPFRAVEDKTGYFLNSSQLDSMTLNEDNIDSFYVWVVSFTALCNDDIPLGIPFDESHCGNDSCEPQFGENALNCDDCGPGDFVSGEVLVLQKITTKTDHYNKNNPSIEADEHYQVHWAVKNYKIHFAWSIEDPDGKFKNGRWIENFMGSRITDDVRLAKAKHWGNNSQVKRTKTKSGGGTKSNRGNHTPFTRSDTLSGHYDKDNDDLYLLFYERDEASFFATSKGGDKYMGCLTNRKPWSFTDGQNDADCDDEVVHIASGASWVTGGSGNLELVVPLDGELTAILELR